MVCGKMWCPRAVVAAIGLLVSKSFSQDSHFLYPSSESNYTFNYLDTANFSWYNDSIVPPADVSPTIRKGELELSIAISSAYYQ